MANKKRNGASFTESEIEEVWMKGEYFSGSGRTEKRKDRCGALMQRDQYGKTEENGLGWEIDHIKPLARGGSDDKDNLQPLQWQNNRHKSDNYPASVADCLIKAR